MPHKLTTRNRCTCTETPDDDKSRRCRFASGHNGPCLFDPKQAPKPGEWDCTTCAFRNSGARTDCSGCGTVKP